VTRICQVGFCACILGALFAAPHAAAAATCTWTGLGTNNNWSTDANWDNCGGAHPTPQTGDSLVFPSGAVRAAPVNDFVNLGVNSVQITGIPASGSSYVISGNGIGLIGSELQFSAPADMAGNGPVFDVPVTLAVASIISNVGTAGARLDAIDLNGFSLILAPGTANLSVTGTITGAGTITKNAPQTLFLQGANTFTGPMQIDAGAVRVRTSTALGSPAAGTTVAAGARLVLEPFVDINEPLTLNGSVLATDGNGGELSLHTWRGSITLIADSAIDVLGSTGLTVSGAISGAFTLTTLGTGTLTLSGANPAFTGQTALQGGLVQVNGSLANSAISLTGGMLSGSGTVGTVTAVGGFVSPNPYVGALNTGDVTLNTGVSFEAKLARSSTPGLSPGQLHVTGTVNLANATLRPALAFLPPQHSAFTIIDNDGSDPVVGTFAGLPEGAKLTISGQPFVISYTGGTGNDVTLTARFPAQYFLSEGATGSFFDEDIVIANPNTVEAPVSLTFLTPAGSPIVLDRTLAAQSRTTIHVDQIAGLEATEASTVVKSNAELPLAVER
jgi:autotransporter-associated beta strand protein